jgi:LCP family protein required for cell wall assembly
LNRENRPLRLSLSETSERSGVVAAALSMLFPGLGHAYLGNRRGAITFALPVLVLIGVLLLMILNEGVGRFGLRFSNPTFALVAAFVAAAVALWWAAGIISAFRGGSQASPSSRLLPVALVAVLAIFSAVPIIPFGAAWFYQLSVADRVSNECDPTLGPCDPSPTPSGIAVGPTTPPPSGPTFPPEDSPEPTEPPATIAPGPTPSFDITQLDAQSDGWLNVLLLGLDVRCAGGLVTGANTDTMMVVSANAATGEVYMFSFPRDIAGFPLYVGGTMPGYWKLNTFAGYTKQHPETFPEPGQPALAYEIGYLLGIPIDYYASINICGFPQLIDEVGGIDICNTKLIEDSGYRWMDGRRGFTLEPGRYHMDGATALAYARSRHGSSDFARAKRQQQILSAVRVALLSPQNIARLPEIVATVGGLVHTNFPDDQRDQLLALAAQVQDEPTGQYVLNPPLWSRNPPLSETNGRSVQFLKIDALAALSVHIFGDASLYESAGPLPSPEPTPRQSPGPRPSPTDNPC